MKNNSNNSNNSSNCEKNFFKRFYNKVFRHKNYSKYIEYYYPRQKILKSENQIHQVNKKEK